MKLYLIRHGQTDWNVQGKIQGSYDSDLNSIGITQAEELSKKIIGNNYKFSKIYSSKQKRAAKTAEILSKAINANYNLVNGLEEIRLGSWEGLSWGEVKESYTEEYEEWFNNRRYTRAPNGESYQDMLNRVLIALRKIIDENCEDVAIVTHSAVIMSLQCLTTDTPFDQMMKFKTDNTAIVEFDSEVVKNCSLK